MSARRSPETPDPAGASKLETTIFGHAREQFEARARALVYARLALMAIGLAVLMVPAWRQALQMPLPDAAYWYLGVLAYHVGSFLWVGRHRARQVIFVSLCLDVVVLLYLVAATGGIKSSLMPTQLVLTVLFALLFPSPLALVPPLLTLPIVAKVDQILGIQTLPGDLLLVLWYSALNITLVYVIVYLDGRQRLALRQLVTLQGQQRSAELAAQRTRLAREIHDSVGARFSGVLLQAEYLQGQVSDPDLKREIADLRETAAESMEELRRAVSVLHRDFQLAAAVPDYLEALAERHRFAAECEVTGREPEADAEIRLALFRIVQEALANVVRHAEAGRVEVRLAFEPQRIVLVVVDDGRGFQPAEVGEGHYGVRNMRERAQKLGGQLEIHSRPGEGTRVVVELPLAGGGQDPASAF